MAKGKPGGKGKTITVKPAKAGQKPITVRKGGLHASTGVPKGQKIPAATVAAAAAGKYGPKARSQALFLQNVLTGPKTGSRKTTTTRRKPGKRKA
jgi:hypothetical protein